MSLNDHEMSLVVGGKINLSGSLISAANRLVKTVYGIGQNVGSTIRRLVDRRLCAY